MNIIVIIVQYILIMNKLIVFTIDHFENMFVKYFEKFITIIFELII